MTLRRRGARLRKAVLGATGQAGEIHELRESLWKERADTAALRRLP